MANRESDDFEMMSIDHGDFGCTQVSSKNGSDSHENHEAPRRIKKDELDFGNFSIIGEGASSRVFKVTLSNCTAAAKQVKQIDHEEVALTRPLCHPNVIHLLGVVNEGTDAFIIMELASGGSLDKYLRSLQVNMGEKKLMKWITEACAAVDYLHNEGIVHRDIKSPNFLISGNGSLKLGDFGLARHLDATVMTTNVRGSLPWMAPEVMAEHTVSKPGDVYSLATVIWEMCTRKIPYEGMDIVHISKHVDAGKRHEIPDGVSRYLKALLKQSWNGDRTKRPTMHDVMDIVNKMKIEKKKRASSSSIASVSGDSQLEIGCQESEGARGICVYRDRQIAVTNRINDTVTIYDVLDGSKCFTLGEENSYHLREPVDVTTTQSSYLVLENSGTIVEFDDEGRYNRRASVGTKGSKAYSIGAGRNGSIIVGAGNTLSELRSITESTDMRVFEIGFKPHYIDVCRKRDEVAIAGESRLEIVDLSTGEIKVKRSIPMVAGVCYNNIDNSNSLYVVQRNGPFGPGVINKHDALNGDFIKLEYEGLLRPCGITLVDSTLVVADWNSIKLFIQ